MKVLITGGNGFLGSSIAKKLIRENHKVLICSSSCSNLKSEDSKFEFISAYISNIHDHIDQIKNFSPDAILLLGWDGANNYKDINNINQFFNNVPDHIKFLISVSKFEKKPRIIGAGSFAEYGDYSIPITEECFEKPTTLYGISKFSLKQYSKLFCEQNGMGWNWIRPCYVYGPNDVSTRLIPTLITKLLKNEKIHLDECDVVLDYLHIEDFTNFMCSLVTSKVDGVFNICSGNQYKLRDVINTLSKLTKSKSEIIFDKDLNRKNSNRFMCGVNSKIKELSNIKDLMTLEKGLLDTIKFHERQSNS